MHFDSKMNMMFSAHPDERRPMPINLQLLSLWRALADPKLGQIIKIMMKNDEKKGLHMFWEKN
jgi:hypothetical protein